MCNSALTLRRYRSYEHYQRDNYIRQLADQGLSFNAVRIGLSEALDVVLETKRVKEIIEIHI
ncbi:Uncharacterized protein ChrSV_2442 [Chromobacterium vaccinii]|nr:Uncharacterized protein ChrSW_2442 [Chromobacterium vaccinii]QND89899.1 Uncharacterized protein ChrSV_2442 [Chromobacterium vaccinii]